MKHIKKFENFSIDETLDMFMMPVDPIRGYEDLWEDFKKTLKIKFNEFISKVKKEGIETKQAFNLCINSAKTGKELSEDQKEKVWSQLKDIFRGIGLGIISVVPGGIIIFMLIKFLKLEKLITPSSFS